jgi:hypothetical protein
MPRLYWNSLEGISLEAMKVIEGGYLRLRHGGEDLIFFFLELFVGLDGF